jgi:hypothetical protein
VLSRVLAFRPATVRGRLPQGSDACPLSLRDILTASGSAKVPVIEAGNPGVMRAALVAAKLLHSTIGLSAPRGIAPERWFDGVGRTADEIAAALPIFLSAEVALEGEGTLPVERAEREIWRLIEAGLTHVAVDATAIVAGERGRVLAEVGAPLQERGLCFDCAIDGSETGAGRRAVALLDDLARRGVPADVISVRCPAASDDEAARAQVGALDRLAAAVGGVAVLRRGPVSPALVAALRGSTLRGCEDGGAAARSSDRSAEEGFAGPGAEERRARWRDRVAAMLGPKEAERLEARAFFAAVDFIEALGAEGSANAVVRGLEERLLEDRV